jgi:hypothetical protein
MATLMIDELLLTELIESLLDWQIENHANIFMYGPADFRGAFSRYYYFSAINQPSALLPLINASKGWGYENKRQPLIDLYQEIQALDSFEYKVKRLARHVLAWGKVIYIKLASLICHKGIGRNRDEKKTIGFFALNTRFVLFFQEVIENLKGYQTIFFSPDFNATDNDILKVGSQSQKLMLGEVRLLDIHIPIRHPLFSTYVSILHFYVRMLGSLKHNQPSVLVFAEGTSMQDEVSSQVAKTLSIPTVRIQSGRGGVMHCGYRNMSFDRMLCWGEGFVKRYKEYSPSPTYEIMGSPLFNGLKKTKKEATNFAVAVFTQPISKHISVKEYTALINVCIAIVNKIPEAKIIVRKHPVDTSNAFDELLAQYPEQVKLKPTTECSLAEVMCKVQCAVGFYSTTLSEAAACDVIPIVMKLREQHSVFPFPEKYGAAIITESEKDTFDIIHSILKTPNKFLETREKMKVFSNEFFGENDGKSLNRIADSILKAGTKQ